MKEKFEPENTNTTRILVTLTDETVFGIDARDLKQAASMRTIMLREGLHTVNEENSAITYPTHMIKQIEVFGGGRDVSHKTELIHDPGPTYKDVPEPEVARMFQNPRSPATLCLKRSRKRRETPDFQVKQDESRHSVSAFFSPNRYRE